VWDTAFTDPLSPATRNARELGLTTSGSGPAAVARADLVVSAVTAAQCVPAAESVVPGLTVGTWFFDLNSSSPGHKQAAAAAIDAAGARYVEAALMSPIGPKRLLSPFLLGGPHAHEFASAAASFGIGDVTVVSDEIGRAAATKLCRSVVVKGLESLLTESLLAARVHGVEREVLDSLPNILPPADWEAVAGYFISRSVQHGKRRSEEMEEAAAMVAEAGIEPWMSAATVERQRWAAQFPQAVGAGSTLAMVDAVLAAMEASAPQDDAEEAPA
jgi:3-hydroxyisobutyrate dehydrogenase-like beta-hydroxyacid dehydrogenase